MARGYCVCAECGAHFSGIGAHLPTLPAAPSSVPLPTDRAATSELPVTPSLGVGPTVFSKLLDEYRDLVIEGEETYSNDDARYAEWDARITASRARLSEYVAGIEARVYAELQEEIYRHVNARTEALKQLAALQETALTKQEWDDLDSALGDSLWGFEKRRDDLDDEEKAFVWRAKELVEKIARRIAEEKKDA